MPFHKGETIIVLYKKFFGLVYTILYYIIYYYITSSKFATSVPTTLYCCHVFVIATNTNLHPSHPKFLHG